MKYVYINDRYMEYLRKIQPRIPYSDYGTRYKPFIGILIKHDDKCFVAPVSSYKKKYEAIKDSPSLITIYDHKYNRPISVVNLSNMFPAPENEIIEVQYRNIDLFRYFENDYEKGQFIAFLKKQLDEIKKLKIEQQAQKIYDIKVNQLPSFAGSRCLNFRHLECKCSEWILKNDFNIDAKIHFDGQGYIIRTDKGTIESNNLNTKEIVDACHQLNHIKISV